MAASDASSCGWSSDTACANATKEAMDVSPSALSTPGGIPETSAGNASSTTAVSSAPDSPSRTKDALQ